MTLNALQAFVYMPHAYIQLNQAGIVDTSKGLVYLEYSLDPPPPPSLSPARAL